MYVQALHFMQQSDMYRKHLMILSSDNVKGRKIRKGRQAGRRNKKRKGTQKREISSKYKFIFDG